MGILSMLFRIGADTTDFEIGAKRVQSIGDKMAKSFKAEAATAVAGLFAVDKIADLGRQAMSTAGRLNDLSDQLGVSVEFLQEMKYAAEMGGSSLDEFGSAIQKISVARTKALTGDDAMMTAFEKLGVSAEQLRSARIEDIFMTIGRSFEGTANPQTLVQAFLEIGGKGAGGLIPAMANGLQDAADRARVLGLVLREEVVNAVDDVNDRVDEMNATLQNVTSNIIGTVVQPLFKYMQAIGAFMQTYAKLKSDFKMSELKGGYFEHIGFMINQSAQSFTSSLEEQENDLQKKRQDRIERSKRLADFESMMPEISKAEQKRMSESAKGANIAFLGAGGDSLARIGGFSNFATGQAQVINVLKNQVDRLDRIVSNTERTATAVTGE